MNWDYFLVQATNGAVIGIIYAMIAVGVTLIFSILKIVNFAHGDLYMLGGYCAYFAIDLLGLHRSRQWSCRWQRFLSGRSCSSV